MFWEIVKDFSSDFQALMGAIYLEGLAEHSGAY
jgi:hypothetical protein